MCIIDYLEKPKVILRRCNRTCYIPPFIILDTSQQIIQQDLVKFWPEMECQLCVITFPGTRLGELRIHSPEMSGGKTYSCRARHRYGGIVLRH